eukprot:scaffold321741_cov26-Prasinocladus_malaysianus.AAC.1
MAAQQPPAFRAKKKHAPHEVICPTAARIHADLMLDICESGPSSQCHVYNIAGENETISYERNYLHDRGLHKSPGRRGTYLRECHGRFICCFS